MTLLYSQKSLALEEKTCPYLSALLPALAQGDGHRLLELHEDAVLESVLLEGDPVISLQATLDGGDREQDVPVTLFASSERWNLMAIFTFVQKLNSLPCVERS